MLPALAHGHLENGCKAALSCGYTHHRCLLDTKTLSANSGMPAVLVSTDKLCIIVSALEHEAAWPGGHNVERPGYETPKFLTLGPCLTSKPPAVSLQDALSNLMCDPCRESFERPLI